MTLTGGLDKDRVSPRVWCALRCVLLPSIYLKEKLINHKYDQVTDNAAQPGGPKGLSTLNLIFNHAVMSWSPEQETARAFLLWAMEPA